MAPIFDPRALIAKIEARLADDPLDARLHFRLGLLYEHLGGHADEARRAYLAHCVRALGCTDAAQAEAALRGEAGRPGALPIVHVRLGELLAHLGRLEEAARALERGTCWETVATDHYRLHVVPGGTACRERALIAQQREQAWTAIHARYELTQTVDGPINWFFYESPLHKKLLTGDGLPAHAFPLEAEVHAVHGLALRIDGPHEDVHVLLRLLGRPTRLLLEGAAEYAGLGPAAHDACVPLLEHGALPSVCALLDDEAFTAADLALAYPVAASFVAFLVERGGVATFKRLYASPAVQTRAALAHFYGRDAGALESEWRAHLAQAPQACAAAPGERD